ncbi:MAG: SDR family oxidoreductase [Burkholderiaceae bacterium]|jgi:NAD(P)-dependent dehydrogenase (short-subunit alcohol dehydrogenase family)
MNPLDFSQKRVLITQSDYFMGPALCEVFRELGATVIADQGTLEDPTRPAQLIAECGEIDVLLLNLGIPAPSTPAAEVSEDEWQQAFSHMVDPLPRLVKAVLPQMRLRGHGKLILIGSASALRGIKRASTYSAARGAQLAYVQALGVELAGQGIQVNAVAQNFVDNPAYFPESVQANPAFQERLRREVPLGRLVSAREDAMFVAYLASAHADCFVGQVFPVCGGWVPR